MSIRPVGVPAFVSSPLVPPRPKSNGCLRLLCLILQLLQSLTHRFNFLLKLGFEHPLPLALDELIRLPPDPLAPERFHTLDLVILHIKPLPVATVARRAARLTIPVFFQRGVHERLQAADVRDFLLFLLLLETLLL